MQGWLVRCWAEVQSACARLTLMGATSKSPADSAHPPSPLLTLLTPLFCFQAEFFFPPCFMRKTVDFLSLSSLVCVCVYGGSAAAAIVLCSDPPGATVWWSPPFPAGLTGATVFCLSVTFVCGFQSDVCIGRRSPSRFRHKFNGFWTKDLPRSIGGWG